MHLVVALSGHGYGHLSQTAPVLRELARRRPDVRLTLWTSLPRALLEERIGLPFDLDPFVTDFGMVMRDALTMDLPASRQRYRELHARWPDLLDDAVRRLEALMPDGLLANIAYLPLAAARRISLPALAFCSLNWAEIWDSVREDQAGDAAILDCMRDAYAGADAFLCPEPAMVMPGLPRRRDVSPIHIPEPEGMRAADRAALRKRLGLAEGVRLAVVATGGIPLSLPIARWPVEAGVFWLVPDGWPQCHPRACSFSDTGLPYHRLAAAADLLLAKPGYATFVEAVMAGQELVSLERPDWPEAPALEAWAQRHGRFRRIQADELGRGLLACLPDAGPGSQPPVARGQEEIVHVLLQLVTEPAS